MKYRFAFRRYRLAFRAPVRTAHGVWTEREGVFVRIEDEAGRAGYGEAAPIVWFGTETADEIAEACASLGEWVEEETLASVPARLRCLRNAIGSASEMLRASEVENGSGEEGEEREENGKRSEASAAYLAVAALLPAGRAAFDVVEAKSEAGFRVFKWKVGVGDVGDELAMLDDVCARLPEGAKLRLDANGAWDRRRAERWLERCAERPVEFIEQPIAADARGAQDGLMGLAGDFPTAIALDESIVADGDVERWLGAGWRGVFVVKTALLAEPRAVLAKLAAAKSAVVFSSALETAVGARAALRHAFEWSGEKRALGFGVWPLFRDGRFDGPAAAAFIRREDVERIDGEAAWNALS